MTEEQKNKIRAQMSYIGKKIDQKKRLLFQKLENEEFEDAAKLRDEVKELQKEFVKVLTY
ncbi:MAG: UvrB/UvrC motif-containing protein [Bacteroidetes bacterium]|nr:UvrB/UvrC motif-containing protein [Bacteroidota bacterium]